MTAKKRHFQLLNGLRQPPIAKSQGEPFDFFVQHRKQQGWIPVPEKTDDPGQAPQREPAEHPNARRGQQVNGQVSSPARKLGTMKPHDRSSDQKVQSRNGIGTLL